MNLPTKRTFRRGYRLLAIGLAMGLILAACGDSDEAEEVATTTTTTVPTTTTEPPATTTTTPPPATEPEHMEPMEEVEAFHPDGMGWELVWSDEFDGENLDQAWDREENCWGGGNNELQCYTDRDDNIQVADGKLHLIAQQESFTGLSVAEDAAEAATAGDQTLPYTSARVRTKGTGEWTYGRFEIRAKLPSGQGIWPAIWMLPTDSPYGGWAAGGEIDIVEAVNLHGNDPAQAATVSGTLHYGGQWPDNKFSGSPYHLPGNVNPADDFHVYAIEWEKGEIRWFVDDIHYATQTQDGWFTEFPGYDGDMVVGLEDAPFDQPFHLIMNVAVGGNWPGPPDQSTTFPVQMEVDYVRVYRCGASPEDGLGCGSTNPDAIQVAGIPPQEPLFGDVLAGDFDPTSLGESFDIFIDDRVYPWDLHSYSASGEVMFELVDTGEEGHNTVIQATYNTNESVVFFQATEAFDLTDWSGGWVDFDLRLIEPGAADSGYMMKIDCIHPCSTGDVPIEPPVVGEWTTYSLSIDELINRDNSGLDMTQVNTPLVVFPAWGDQNGAVYQIDNVRWRR